MDTDRTNLSTTITSNNIDKLLWNITYINNAVLGTPLKKDIRIKVLNNNEVLKALYQEAFPEEYLVNQLIYYLNQSDQLFVEYVESVVLNSNNANSIKLKWQEANSKIAFYLNKINAYWKYSEWNGMLSQNIDLLDILTTTLKKNNYSGFTNTIPICRRLSFDMADYVTAGIIDYIDRQQV